MFIKGSRYYKVTQSRHLTAAGEWVLSSDLRFITPVSGQFLHTVSAHERLDLIAYRYYTDPRKWWLVADANPGTAFPLDLLDTAPIVEEVLALQHPGYLVRLARLGLALQSFSPTVEGETAFFSTRVTVMNMTATTRALITDEIGRTGFQLVDSFDWSTDAGTAESFLIEDRKVKQAWNDLVATLASLVGVIEASSVVAGEVLRVRYNQAQVSRVTLVGQAESRGFEVVPQDSTRAERVGSRIVIPPNQA